jgi:hypothetical protein
VKGENSMLRKKCVGIMLAAFLTLANFAPTYAGNYKDAGLKSDANLKSRNTGYEVTQAAGTEQTYTVTFDSLRKGRYNGIKTKEVKAGEKAGESGFKEHLMGAVNENFLYWTVDGEKVDPVEYAVNKDTTFKAEYKTVAIVSDFDITLQAETDEDYDKLMKMDAGELLKLEYVSGIGDYTNEDLNIIMKRTSTAEAKKMVTYRPFDTSARLQKLPEGTYKLTVSGLDADLEYGVEDKDTGGFLPHNQGGSFTFRPSEDNKVLDFDLKFENYTSRAGMLVSVKAKQEKALVKFAFNQDDTGIDIPESQEIAIGDSLKLPGLSNEVTDKYSFLGWDTDGNGEADADPGQSFKVEENTTITGIWEHNIGKIGFVFHTKEFTGDSWQNRTHEVVKDLTGYNVILKDESGKSIERAETTSTGKIFFDKLPKGNYTFELEVPQNVKVKKNVDGNESASQEKVVPFEGQIIALPHFQRNLSMEKLIFVEVEENFTVTIDPNGGTIKEDYRTATVEKGSTYTLPSYFKSEIAKEGYTIAGYDVEGTLKDKQGKELKEIKPYGKEYIPESDVVLKAKWEKTAGEVVILLTDGHPAEQKDKYTLKLVSGDGDEYSFTSNSYSTDGTRTWRAKGVPNGEYELKIEGLTGKYVAEASGVGGSEFLTREISVNNAGSYKINVAFEDNESSQFVRYAVKITPAYTVTFDSLREGRNNGKRVKDVKEGEVAGDSGFLEFIMGTPHEEFIGWTVGGEDVDPAKYVVKEDTVFEAKYKEVAVVSDFSITFKAETDEDYKKLEEMDKEEFLKLEYLKGIGDYTNEGLNIVMKRHSLDPANRMITYWVEGRPFDGLIESHKLPEGTYKLTISGLDLDLEYGIEDQGTDGFQAHNRGGSFAFRPSEDKKTLEFDMKFEDNQSEAGMLITAKEMEKATTDKEALRKALEEATALKPVTVSNDGSEVSRDQKWTTQEENDLFLNAIKSAKAVYENADAGQEDIDEATSNLIAAIDAYNKAQKDGQKEETISKPSEGNTGTDNHEKGEHPNKPSKDNISSNKHNDKQAGNKADKTKVAGEDQTKKEAPITGDSNNLILYLAVLAAAFSLIVKMNLQKKTNQDKTTK